MKDRVQYIYSYIPTLENTRHIKSKQIFLDFRTAGRNFRLISGLAEIYV